MVDVYVGAGSNLDPVRHLEQAVAALAERFAAVRCSGVYRSPALGLEGPDFLNLVVGFSADAAPAALNETLRTVEAAAGRSRSLPKSSVCSLDLDLLIYGRRVDPDARLPRADVLHRAFVLAPLAELDAQLRHPVTGERIGAAWAALAATGPVLERLGPLRS